MALKCHGHRVGIVHMHSINEISVVPRPGTLKIHIKLFTKQLYLFLCKAIVLSNWIRIQHRILTEIVES